MSSIGKRRFTLRHPAVVDVGCSCRRTKLASLFSSGHQKPKPNPQTPSKHNHPLSSYYPFSPSTTTFSTTTISPWESSSTTSHYEEYSLTPPHTEKKKKAHKTRVAKESVAVVKESQDPYHDFRDSMLQMILEKEIYAIEDLRDLLQRFLSLNSPYHHDSILKAFSEIWNSVFSSSSSSTKPIAATARSNGQRRRHRHQHHRRLSRDPPGYGP